MKSLPPYLMALGRSVSALSDRQILQYFEEDKLALRRVLERARLNGFIQLDVELVRPREISGPITVLHSGERGLDAEHVAYVASKLWSDSLRPELVVRATGKLCALTGGEARTIASAHLSHELAVSEVYLHSVKKNPSFEWSLVNAAPGHGSLPDAVAAGVAIELVGRYSGMTVAAKASLSAQTSIEFW